MNLVKLITDQISSDALAKICSLLGIDRDTAESAISAAVPTMLAGMGGLASSEDGLRKLTATLGSLDDSAFGNFDRLIGGDTNSLLQKGGGLLNSLLGSGLTGGIATAISRFTGLAPDTVKSLLAYLAPVVVGRVASQWQNQGGTAAALKNLFAEQKRHIEDALPAGFALGDVPGLNRLGDAGRAAVQHAETTSKSLASTLIPLVLLAAGAFLIWNLWNNRPAPQQADVEPAAGEAEAVVAMKPVTPENPAADLAVPDVGSIQREIAALYDSLGKTFGDITDAASAEAALPKLEQMLPQIDQLSATWQRLPAAGRLTLNTIVRENFTKLKERAGEILMLPGLSERVKTLINEILEKLVALQTAAAPATTATT